MAQAIDSTTATAAADANEGGKGYTRMTIPWIIDKIDITDPELIKKITVHPDVDRIHGVAQKDKPWWVKAYFPVTRFQDREDGMFVPLTSTKDPNYTRRRQYVVDRVQNGIAREDVEKVASLLHTGAPDAQLECAVVNAVNRRFYGRDVPPEIVKSAGKTCDKLSEAVTSGYLPPLYHQNKVLKYINNNSDLHEGCPAADFSHHIGASVLLLTKAVKFLHNKSRDMPIDEIFTQNDMPMTIQTPRIAIRDTTIDGILDKPAKANWTVFVLQIRQAAAETGDTLFTFGAGQDVRQCAFKYAFMNFMKDLQDELKRLEASESGHNDQGGDTAGGEETKQGDSGSGN